MLGDFTGVDMIFPPPFFSYVIAVGAGEKASPIGIQSVKAFIPVISAFKPVEKAFGFNFNGFHRLSPGVRLAERKGFTVVRFISLLISVSWWRPSSVEGKQLQDACRHALR